MASRMVPEVAHRDALAQQVLQDALDAGDRDLSGRDVVDEGGLRLGQVFDQLLHRAEGQQSRPCSPSPAR